MNIIPARGTVEFLVYPWHYDENGKLNGDGVGEPDLTIDGPERWSRPVVALIESRDYIDALNPEQAAAERAMRHDHAWNRHLHYAPIVVDECGLLFEVYDYIESVMGGCHWDHSTHFYQPHVDGPVTNAPRIREVPPSVTA
jgi:hypothetical protein